MTMIQAANRPQASPLSAREAMIATGGPSGPGAASTALAQIVVPDDVAFELGWREVWMAASAGSVLLAFGCLTALGATASFHLLGLHPLIATGAGIVWAVTWTVLQARLLRSVVRHGPDLLATLVPALFGTAAGIVAALPPVGIPWLMQVLGAGLPAFSLMLILAGPFVSALTVMAAVAPIPGLLSLTAEGLDDEVDQAAVVVAPSSEDRPHWRRGLRVSVARLTGRLGGMRGDLAWLWPSLARAYRPRVAVLVAGTLLGGVAGALATASVTDDWGAMGIVAVLWASICFAMIRHRWVESAAARGRVIRVGAAALSVATTFLIATVTTILLAFGLVLREEVLGSIEEDAVADAVIALLVTQSGAGLWAIACLWALCLLCFGLPLVRFPVMAAVHDLYNTRRWLIDRRLSRGR